MSSSRFPSSSSSCGGRGVLPPLRMRTNSPPPEQWTLVREYNMEERDSYKNWKCGIATQLDNLTKQMTAYGDIIEALEREIEEARMRRFLYSSRSAESTTSDTEQDEVGEDGEECVITSRQEDRREAEESTTTANAATPELSGQSQLQEHNETTTTMHTTTKTEITTTAGDYYCQH